MSDYVSEEILQWLPAKSLLRFRCVCKDWKELIDSPRFLHHHLSLQKPKLLLKYEQPELLVLDPSTLPSFKSLALPPPFSDESGPIKPHRLVGTLHGVVCLHDNINQILIWNPATHKSSTIPSPTFHYEFENPINVNLRPYCGFWLNPSDKHYKIIMFKLVYIRDPHLDGYLYSSIDRVWKPVSVEGLEAFKPYGSEGPPVMIGTVAYWKANCIYHDDNWVEDHLFPVVLSYDFASEKGFDSIKLPEKALSLKYHPILCILRDSLALVSWELWNTDTCDVHIRVDSAWVNIMSFELYISAVYSIQWMLGDDVETCKVIAVAVEEELVLYDSQVNLQGLESPVTVLKSPLKEHTNMYVACDFVESLLFP